MHLVGSYTYCGMMHGTFNVKLHKTLPLLIRNQDLKLSVCSVGSAKGTDSLALISVFVRNLRVSLSIESVSHSNLEASVPLAAYDTH